MNRLARTLTTIAATGAMLAGTTGLAFAASPMHPMVRGKNVTVVKTSAKNSILVTVPNLDHSLKPAPELTFVFTIGNPGMDPMKETGMLVRAKGMKDAYLVPLPNYGQTYTDVYVSTNYMSNGTTYTMSAGPLVDTLPEVGLAAILPAGLLGVLYAVRKRRLSTLN